MGIRNLSVWFRSSCAIKLTIIEMTTTCLQVHTYSHPCQYTRKSMSTPLWFQLSTPQVISLVLKECTMNRFAPCLNGIMISEVDTTQYFFRMDQVMLGFVAYMLLGYVFSSPSTGRENPILVHSSVGFLQLILFPTQSLASGWWSLIWAQADTCLPLSFIWIPFSVALTLLVLQARTFFPKASHYITPSTHSPNSMLISTLIITHTKQPFR